MHNKLFIKNLICLILICSMLFLFSGCRPQQETKVSPMSITLLKVGKADAIVVLSGKHALLIDTGEEDDGEEVLEFLQQNDIVNVDSMIITHFDQDHVGGADTILENINVKDIYLPDYEGTHTEYTDFMTAVKNSSSSVHRLNSPVSFSFKDAQILIDPPSSYEIDDPDSDYDNNFSLITTIIHGKNRLVFTGDAEKARIREWIKSENATKCDFLKVPHHGIYNTALKELFEKLDPEISVICSSKKNPANTKTLDLLHSYCPQIYETKDGNVLIISNGEKLECSQQTKH